MNRNHVFDSTGPDMRLRGTAQQLFEKYLQLGRDATSGGDRVMAEGYFQHAEHYFRILNAMSQAQQGPAPQHQQGQPRGRYQGPDQGGEQGQEAEQPEFGSQGGAAGGNLEAELEAEVQQIHAEPREARDREPRDRDRDSRERDARDRDNRERDQG